VRVSQVAGNGKGGQWHTFVRMEDREEDALDHGQREVVCMSEGKSEARAWWSCRRWNDATARRGEDQDLVQFRLDRLDEMHVRRRNFPFREGIRFWFIEKRQNYLSR
jgi:hypothetical protein